MSWTHWLHPPRILTWNVHIGPVWDITGLNYTLSPLLVVEKTESLLGLLHISCMMCRKLLSHWKLNETLHGSVEMSWTKVHGACNGHFQLHIHFWPLDGTSNCLTLITNMSHERCRFKCQDQSWDVKSMRCLGKKHSFSLSNHIGPPHPCCPPNHTWQSFVM